MHTPPRRRGGLIGWLTGTAFPASTDLGLLLLRLWTGLTLLVLHGWPKIPRLLGENPQFADPIGLGPVPSLALATMAEVIGSLLLAIGLATRWAALAIACTLLVAWQSVHAGALSGENSGELPFLFAGAALAIVVAGPGRFSLDARLSGSLR